MTVVLKGLWWVAERVQRMVDRWAEKMENLMAEPKENSKAALLEWNLAVLWVESSERPLVVLMDHLLAVERVVVMVLLMADDLVKLTVEKLGIVKVGRRVQKPIFLSTKKFKSTIYT